MSTPALPRFILRRGQHEVEVLDPRPNPLVLGARYVHGGYIYAWSVAGRTLTCGPTRYWNDFGGRGLPETFELPLAWAHAQEGEHFCRIGAGQLRKRGAVGEDGSLKVPLQATVDWEVREQSDEHIVMRTRDGLESMNWMANYELERTVRVHDDGVESRTTLTLRCGRFGQHPISWFAHPFLRQTALGATALTAAGAALIGTSGNPMWRMGSNTGSLARGEDGRWRFGEGFTRSVLGGLWGSTADLVIDLDPALGGGQVAMQLDRPLDHVVVWGAAHVFSAEPKICRLWTDGETASWGIRYRFAPGAGG